MPSLFNIIDTIIKAKIDKLNIGNNKVDKSVNININYVDNSTNFNYSGNIPLPPEQILQLSDEEVGKVIKEHTMSNIKEACKDKPKEMEDFLAKYNLSMLSVAGTTTTTKNLIPWLTGETKTEPIEPMPSGDFIEQLPNAINKISTIDTFKITEYVNVKIEDKNKKESS